jgi:hypothetical protein
MRNIANLVYLVIMSFPCSVSMSSSTLLMSCDGVLFDQW